MLGLWVGIIILGATFAIAAPGMVLDVKMKRLRRHREVLASIKILEREIFGEQGEL